MNTVPPHALDNNPCYVYGLLDPRNQSVFYVGITINLYERYKQHMRCDGINPQKDAKIQEILQAGFLPVMNTLEQVSQSEALKREQYWIQHYSRLGVLLMNAQVREERVKPKTRQPLKIKPVSPICTQQNGNIGRRGNFVSMVEMLVAVHETHRWPEDVSPPMRRYYKRTYPEFFRNGKKWAKMREERIQKAALLKNQHRPSRSKKLAQ